MSDAGGIPLDIIRQWPKPNYVNPEQRGWDLVVACVVLYVLAVVVVSLRLFARFVKLKSGGIDDYLVAASMVPLLGLNISLCLAAKEYHFDRHLWDVPPKDIRSVRKVIIAVDFLFVVSTGLVKLAVLFLYRRLAAGAVTPAIKWISRLCILFVLLYILGFIVGLFLVCIPFNAFWNSFDPMWLMQHKKGTWWCADKQTMYVSNGAISIIQDFVACTMPLLLVRKLQLSKWNKFCLGAIFMAGYCLCITSIVRTINIVQVLHHRLYDLTWSTNTTFLLTTIDANLAVVFASLPCLRVYFRNWPTPSIFARFDKSTSGSRTWWSGTGNSRKDDYGPHYPLQDINASTVKSFQSQTELVARAEGDFSRR